jgi:hypothetical protein
MKFLYALLAGSLSATLSLAATAADWSVDVVALPGGVAGLLDDQGRTVARTRSGVFFHLTLDEDVKFRASRLASYTPPKGPSTGGYAARWAPCPRIGGDQGGVSRWSHQSL